VIGNRTRNSPLSRSPRCDLIIFDCDGVLVDIERIDHSLQPTALAEMVAGRVFSADLVANGKPAPDLFLHAAARMGAAPEKTPVIEDSVSGVQAAKAAGADRMADFHHNRAELLDGAVR
jgi:beta-phosphoglucomutase-like phosphatase (HAD superfamily)